MKLAYVLDPSILIQAYIADTDSARVQTLLAGLETDALPRLSLSNVCELLRAALPLRQLSTQEAAALVLQHLDNRTRSRLRKHSRP